MLLDYVVYATWSSRAWALPFAGETHTIGPLQGGANPQTRPEGAAVNRLSTLLTSWSIGYIVPNWKTTIGVGCGACGDCGSAHPARPPGGPLVTS